MTQTTTLSQLVLKEYYRSRTDPDAFEWVYFGHLPDFFETISPDTAESTDLGLWIRPLDVAALIDSCSQDITEDKRGYHHLQVALTIAVLAGSKELGAVIASMPGRRDLGVTDAPVYARAAEILGAFSPEFLSSLRETVDFGDKEAFNALTGQESSFISELLASAAGLLLRHGTAEDREEIAHVIDEASPAAGYPLLYQYCTAGFDVDDEFVAEQVTDLQKAGFPVGIERNIALFCELAARTFVTIDFETLQSRFAYGWIEGILHRMLRDPKRFHAQADALYAVLPEIQDEEDCGALGGVAYARIGGTGEALQQILGEPGQWEIPAAAYLAAVDDYTPEYFTELAATEREPDLILILRFLGSQCSPGTPQLDLSLVHLAFREAGLGQILLYDPRLRAPRESFLGLFQAAVAGEEVSDAECVLLLAITEPHGTEEHIIGGSVSFEDHHVSISEKVGGDLVRAVIEYDGAQTRALLLHWLLLWGSEKVTRDTLLVLIAYLDGPESWIEPVLRRFYGVDQTDASPWLEGDEALLIEGFHAVPKHDLEGIVRAMTETELYRRPGLISHMWEAPYTTLWMDA